MGLHHQIQINHPKWIDDLYITKSTHNEKRCLLLWYLKIADIQFAKDTNNVVWSKDGRLVVLFLIFRTFHSLIIPSLIYSLQTYVLAMMVE
jgi:hypothetical protein